MARLTAKLAPMPARAVPARAEPLQIADGTLEGMKWLALLLMTADHVNRYLFGLQLPGVVEAGRVAMPLFVFVLACNLARPGAVQAGAHLRTARRLACYGALASVPYMALAPTLLGGWWPLNIMFTLLAATVMIGSFAHGGQRQVYVAAAAFCIGGALAEYWWPALALALAAWCYCRRPTPWRFAAMATAIAALWLVEHSLWALAALPVIAAAPHVQLRVPRAGHLFYAYYPLHLAAIWALSQASH
jgi:hypothetical protein